MGQQHRGWGYKLSTAQWGFVFSPAIMSDVLPRIVDYIEELRDEYSRQTFANLLVEFLDDIIPGHCPANQKSEAVKDFVARFTNITISGTESRRIVYGLRILDAMIAILRSPIVGAIHFEHSEVERLSPLEEQLRWEIVENATSRFRRYWDVSHLRSFICGLQSYDPIRILQGRFGLKTRDKYNLSRQRPQILFEYISGLASRGFITQEPYTRMLLTFMHNFQNRLDLKNGACLFQTFTCPTLFMKDADVLYEVLGVLRYRCRELFGMDTIGEVTLSNY